MFRVSKLVINIVIFVTGDFYFVGFHIFSRSIEISPKTLVQFSFHTKQYQSYLLYFYTKKSVYFEKQKGSLDFVLFLRFVTKFQSERYSKM
jgi:hypothetical protein